MKDVVVIGSGPSGAMAANVAAQKGLDVLLLDKAKFPRYKPCGGGFGAKVLDLLPDEELKELSSAKPNYGLHLVSPSLEFEAKKYLKKNVGYFISRKDFDYYLHKKAITNGAEFKREKVENTEYDKYCVKVTTNKGLYETRVLIIANGVYSKFPKRFDLHKPYDATTVGLTYNSETKMSDKKIDSFMGKKRLTTIFFGIVKRGYGWIFPMKGKINIGVGCTKKYFKQVPKVYEKFLETIENYFDISTLKLSKPRGYVVPFKEPMKKTYADRVMVIGDAAWMVSGLTAEGICYALKSGKLAAETAAEALHASNTSEAFLERYQIKWKEDYGYDLSKYSTRLQNILYKNNKRMELVVKMAANDEKMLNIMTDTITGSISYKSSFNSMLKRGFISLAKSL